MGIIILWKYAKKSTVGPVDPWQIKREDEKYGRLGTDVGLFGRGIKKVYN